MADLQKTIEIIFDATDKTNGAVSSVSSGLSSFESHVGNVTGPIADLTTSVLKYEAVVAGLAAAYAAFTIKQAADFESSQISLAKVLTGSPESITESMKLASAEAVRLSEQYGISSSTILEGMAQFKQSGFTALEAAELQKSAMDLVIAGGVNAATATNLLTRSLIGFGASADEATRFTEALNNVSNKYNTNLELLALGMSKLSPIANLMGFSFEEAAGLLTPIIEVFGSGREAATALKTGLLKLIDDTKPVKDALASLGVSQFELNGEMRLGKDIFFDVATAFETLNERQKINFTQQLVGIEQAGRMATVFSNLGKVNEITAVAMERTGSVTKEVTLRLASSEIQAKRTVQAFNNMSTEIGTNLLPGFNDVNDGLRTLLISFREIVADGGLDPLFDSINSQGVELKDFLISVAEALPEAFAQLDFSAMLASFDNLKQAIGGLFGDLDLTKPDDLAKALQGVLDFLALMTNATSGVVRGFEPFIEAITSILTKLSEFDPDNQEFIGFLSGSITAIDAILPLLGFVVAALSALGAAFSAMASVKFAEFLGVIASRLALLNPPFAIAVGVLGALTVAFIDVVSEQKKFDEASKKSGDAIFKMAENIRLLSKATGDNSITFDNYHQKLAEFGETTAEAAERARQFGLNIDETKTNFTDVNEVMSLSDQITGSWITTLRSSEGPLVDSVNNILNLGHASGLTTEQIEASLSSYDVWLDGVRQGSRDLTELEIHQKAVNAVNEEAKVVIDEVAESIGELTEHEKVAIENTQEMEIVLENLASNEKIAAMEFTANIRVAELEADAKKVEAIMGSVTAVFENTADVIEALVLGFDAAFTDEDRDFFKDQIEKRLQLERDLADQLIEFQKAQVVLMKAQAKALGDGVDIKISSEGLEPEIQAFMFKILDNIRTTVAADKAAFLLGI